MEYVSGSCGFDCLGAEPTSGDKALDVIKKAGPGLVSAIADQFDKKKAEEPKVDPKRKVQGEGLSTVAKIGIAVGAVFGGGLLGFGIYKLAKR